MLVENSVVIANFVKGLFVPLGFLTGGAIIIGIILLMYASIEERPKVLYWEIPIGIFLFFAIWFYSTFTMK